MKSTYVYPAVFHYSDDGISVSFPDLPGCFSAAETDEEALRMAQEALALHLYGLEQDGEPIPNPSEARQVTLGDSEVVALIRVWMPPFRDEMQNRAVKKTLTIPRWLDDIALEHKVNFSHILQQGLMEYLGVDRPRARIARRKGH